MAEPANDPGPTPVYPQTPRTTPARMRERARYDEATVHAILDSDVICHVAFTDGGAPAVLPTSYTRLGRFLYLHASTGSTLALRARHGLAVSVAVTRVDGFVLARSANHHSVNYRSVIAHGTAHRVSDPGEARRALAALLDQVVPGRSGDARPPSDRELAATAVLCLELAEVAAKVRQGGVNDDPEDAALPHWAGVLPLTRRLGTPVPDPALPPGTPLPDYLRHATEPGRAEP
ncbi:pyridoxamine 5'-phosphate oxidase family protein [Allonocardiopsis opalescens]|uniref:Nitroimidazol reductase NimA-like FMN-containing flavoprotein (Pyridoxamine 5'-phosphate oxidase superfamily) n=1 Tax=Allonocardiopsis opalescens TaxID=1144618 RepID=A0A2T0PTN1_9ACTN|nr:pyridoxamine 5'-phosphate oxidase family protein [Allonocardiopsis opalescens]PRX92259.1 hypothetical protein CLV72_11019 [Allonocardiopsis opalescens]